MSSFFGICRNRMMSPVLLIYSRCGRCYSPQCLVGGSGGKRLEDTQSHHWLAIALGLSQVNMASLGDIY